MSTTIDTEHMTRLDIRRQALANEAFRRVIHTGSREQVVVMTLPPNGEIGAEVHPDTDQVFILMDGTGESRVEGDVSALETGDLVFVEAGKRHNILNRGPVPLG